MMNLQLDIALAKGYSNNSQIVKILTEHWVYKNSFCPNCGNHYLNKFENNRPVADFYCDKCQEEFELKSKKGILSNKINDGAYSTMIERINSANNPNFFFLTYSKQWSVNDFMMIPKHFFTPDIIIQRKPLSMTARRAGWVGCNIDISRVPDAGKFFFVRGAKCIQQEVIQESYHKMVFIRGKNIDSKGWIIDFIKCLEVINKQEFSLKEVYKFEDTLRVKYPENNFIKDKIRQQLQVLRDKGLLEFLGNGNYKKLWK
ncbi:DpnI domain-containing protein [Runella sp. MFBS21]|uniref:DpnI domain-containing protein n=1 Tax=Runella sp. MFBS21 TaxID=3034018 RepID=UPI0023F8E75E|nr:DpnI domain-containing protein [Runella sp. MFBS21]MDF7820074.1 DpnI domain-containing protein [Runella sp. MFBS21]